MLASETPVSTPSVIDPTPQGLAAIREQLRLLTEYLDPEQLAARVGELEGAMGDPGFWDDAAAAAKTSAEHARAARRLEAYRSLAADVEDLEGLIELADEDPEIAAELETQF